MCFTILLVAISGFLSFLCKRHPENATFAKVNLYYTLIAGIILAIVIIVYWLLYFIKLF